MITDLFVNDVSYENLLKGLSKVAMSSVKEFSISDTAGALKEGIESDDTFIYDNLQSDIRREFRMLTIGELLNAVESSDSYGQQAPINYTSISAILTDPHIGLLKVNQLLIPPHVVERRDIVTGQLHYVGVGLRHRITTIFLLAFSSGIDIEGAEFLAQEIECMVSSTINAEGHENTLLSGALVLADNASRKAFAGEKDVFKLSSLGVEYTLDALVAAAYTGVMMPNEAFGTALTLCAIEREPTTVKNTGKSFYGKVKKYITSKVMFVGCLEWLENNWFAVETKFLAQNTSETVSRHSSKFADALVESWKLATKPVEPEKIAKKATAEKISLFRKRV